MNRAEARTDPASEGVFYPTSNGNLPPMPYRDMPEPLPLGKVLGPSVILAGLGAGHHGRAELGGGVPEETVALRR